LNIDLAVNKESQECKIGIVCVGGGKVNEGDEGEGIWLMDVIYLYKIEQ
jgi:hypothetical protein